MPANLSLDIRIAPPLDEERSVAIAADVLRASYAAGARESDLRVEVSLAPDGTNEPLRPGTLATVAEQRCAVRYGREGSREVVRLEAGGALGAAFALARLADRLRVPRHWPPSDADESPAFAQRIAIMHFGCVPSDNPPYIDVDRSRAQANSSTARLDTAVRAGITAVALYDTQQLVPWEVPIHAERSAACRELFAAFIREAHARRIRVYSMGDEFIYLADWFARTGATLSVDDPRFYDALKVKYRALLAALPDLDGIATRTGEIVARGDYRAWDPIHTADERSIELTYRRFIRAMHEVVVGECGRQYLHRTWVVNTWEQASVPEIFQRTFTGEVPTNDLLVSIKLTTGDQWEWQPINPTFGVTPHATAALVETARAQDYFSGPPDFAVEFAQAGLEMARERGATAMMANLRDLEEENLWAAMEDVAWRLAWDPYRSVRDLVADRVHRFAGDAFAERVADLLLDLDDIYRDGFHIRGPSYHTWEPLIHVRSGWICAGNPFIDGGRGQHRFLREQYLQAKPELESGLRIMRACVDRYARWLADYRDWMGRMPAPARGTWLEKILDRGRNALRMNFAYVSAFLRYFDYEDNPDDEHRALAERAADELAAEVERFVNAGTWREAAFHAAGNVRGIRVFLDLARRGLADRAAFRREMIAAPDAAGIKRILEDRQAADERLVRKTPEAVRWGRWAGLVDGREVFRVAVQSGRWESEPEFGDGAITHVWTFGARPTGPGRFALTIDAGTDRGHAYVVEQPTAENGRTLTFIVDDEFPSWGRFDLALWWVPGPGGASSARND